MKEKDRDLEFNDKKVSNNKLKKDSTLIKPEKLKVESFIKFIPVIIMFIFIIFVLLNKDSITVENILKFTPENMILAFLLILFLYFIKSISIVFPIAILHIVSGKLFSVGTALIINFLGLIIVFSIPYIIGKFSGENIIKKIKNKYPKVNEIDNFKNENAWVFTFIFRILRVIPGDIGSMLLGALNTDYIKYIVVSLLVRIPSMVTMTIFGNNITNPRSTEFILSILARGLIFLVSLVLIYFINKKKLNKANS